MVFYDRLRVLEFSGIELRLCSSDGFKTELRLGTLMSGQLCDFKNTKAKYIAFFLADVRFQSSIGRI